MYKSRRKKKNLHKQGYGYSPTASDDDEAEEANEMLERVGNTYNITDYLVTLLH